MGMMPMQEVHMVKKMVTTGRSNNTKDDKENTKEEACKRSSLEILGLRGTLAIFDRLATLWHFPAEVCQGCYPTEHRGWQEDDWQLPRPKMHAVVRPEAMKVPWHVNVAVVFDHKDSSNCEEEAWETAEHKWNCLWTTGRVLLVNDFNWGLLQWEQGTLATLDHWATLRHFPAEVNQGGCPAEHRGWQEDDRQLPRPKMHVVVRSKARKVPWHVNVAVVFDHKDGGDCEEEAWETAEHKWNCLWTTGWFMPLNDVNWWLLQWYHRSNHNSNRICTWTQLFLWSRCSCLHRGWLWQRLHLQGLHL
jgi:hypothetical protein